MQTVAFLKTKMFLKWNEIFLLLIFFKRTAVHDIMSSQISHKRKCAVASIACIQFSISMWIARRIHVLRLKWPIRMTFAVITATNFNSNGGSGCITNGILIIVLQKSMENLVTQKMQRSCCWAVKYLQLQIWCHQLAHCRLYRNWVLILLFLVLLLLWIGLS